MCEGAKVGYGIGYARDKFENIRGIAE